MILAIYCLDEDDLIDDLNILWVARQLCPQEPTKSAITALPTLPQEQAKPTAAFG